jgi:ribonucleoside-diphosphate reductase alpha chain
MIGQHRPSAFLEPAAVEAWDAWFRWRDRAGLHDVSIEDTWHRVVTALAGAEDRHAGSTWGTRWMDAFLDWRLLPDGRLLAAAGTGRVTWRAGPLDAVLNLARFVPAGGSPAAKFNLAAVADCAELAVRAMDNAAMIAGIGAPVLRIGVVGMADALALLGADFDSDAGRAWAIRISAALAEGCFRASVRLAAERGASPDDTSAIIARAALRKMPHELLRDANVHRLRHTRLTAVTSQRRLALLANDVADALDPLQGGIHSNMIAAPGGQRTVQSLGYAVNVLRARGDRREDNPDILARPPWSGQLAMRAAVQPWMDDPIDYPLLTAADPDDDQRRDARRQAARHGLGEPAWRNASELIPA